MDAAAVTLLGLVGSLDGGIPLTLLARRHRLARVAPLGALATAVVYPSAHLPNVIACLSLHGFPKYLAASFGVCYNARPEAAGIEMAP